ncbi:ATP synthase j chain-domain-containing protein [Irpex rosettiformis]|uniref:ATP synthase j chain-domain-containing protein n=1 Tax=Irpex rosettiformis TaxID=378272 RepID=A0ACB8UIH2_9APHY|nr:ATP synthase j chain-domain-containing protein [Irpex rosettiformis]
MSFLGFRRYPTPIVKPLWPFAAASLITFTLISKAQDAAIRSDAYKNDPRNPYREQLAREDASAHH